VVLAVVMAAASVLTFRNGGYRALLVLLAVFVVSLSIVVVLRGATWRDWAKGIAIGGSLGGICGAVAPHVFKGPYLVFAIVFAGCCWQAWRQRPSANKRARAVALAAYVWLVIAAALVAFHWGGAPALYDSSFALLLVQGLLVWSARSKKPLWGESLRVQGLLVGAVVIVAGAVAVFAGGAYMGGRFASAEQDLAGRTQHWREGLSLLRSPAEWLVGKGLGRFPESYYYAARDPLFPGSYRLVITDGNAMLTLAGPRYPTRFGDLFRIAQRVPAARGAYVATFDVRAEAKVQIHVEVCEQHLLYNEACAIAAPVIEATDGSWRRIVVPLDGRQISGGRWYAPRLAFFSLAVASSGQRVDLDNVGLVGPSGADLVANGGFEDGTARWFIISERHHLPWHIKNIALDVLFDQGIVGLLLFGLLVGGALWRLVWGGARGHPLAPYLAASLIGFLVIGAFDSLLDVPRVALLFYLLVLLSLALRRVSGQLRTVRTSAPAAAAS
jgi:O-antigen ligase